MREKLMGCEIYFDFEGHEVSYKKLKLMVDDPVVHAALDHLMEIAEELGTTPCPVHGKLPTLTVSVSKNGDINIKTRTCCDEQERSTSAVMSPFRQTAYFTPGLRLMLVPEHASRPFIFDAEQIERIIIGRSDPDVDTVPDVDLCEHRAIERGVSRRHASIFWHRGALHIMDEGSSNGTRLNGELLEPHEPAILRDGDEIMLGLLPMQVMLIDD